MNKKILAILNITFLMGLVTLFAACGDDEKRVDFEDMPTPAQQFVTTFFPGASVLSVVKETDDGRTEYDVTLADGTEIRFDESGDWQSVETKFGTLPAGIIATAIEEDVATRYPGSRIYGAEKELGGLIVEIYDSTGAALELRYSQSGEFVGQQIDR